MSQWPRYPIGSVCSGIESWDPRSAPDDRFTYIDIASVDNQTKSIGETKVLLGIEAPSRARKRVRAGDVLVSTVRPNLNAVARVPEHLDGAICSTGFCVLSPAEVVFSAFVFHFVRSSEFINELSGMTKGASYPAVSDSDAKGVLIPVPPLPEQERIVRLLDEADALRKLRAQADQRTAQFIPALFHDMFGDKDLALVQLGKLTDLVTSGVTPRGGSSIYVDQGPVLIRSQNVRMNKLDLTEVACLPDSVFERMSRVQLAEGDVLLNITGASIGRVTWVDQLAQKAVVSQHVCLIRPLCQHLNATYLSVFISLPSTQQSIIQVQAGASRQALNHNQVRSLEVPLPPMTAQREFADQVARMQELETSRRISADRLDSLFQSMLHRSFAGEL